MRRDEDSARRTWVKPTAEETPLLVPVWCYTQRRPFQDAGRGNPVHVLDAYDVAILQRAGCYGHDQPDLTSVRKTLLQAGVRVAELAPLTWDDILAILDSAVSSSARADRREPALGLTVSEAERISGINRGTISNAYHKGLINGTGERRSIRLEHKSFHQWQLERDNRRAATRGHRTEDRESNEVVERKCRDAGL